MPVIPEARRYSVAEVLAFPNDGNRYEVVAGELLVSPAPRNRHQTLVARLFTALQQYLMELGLKDPVKLAPADITWGIPPREAEDLVQPDVFVPDPAQAQGDWVRMRNLELAAEVLSPSTTRADRVVKRKTYQRHGVATYWVVDDEARLVEVWGPDDDRPEIITEVLRWRFRGASDELRIPLEELLRRSSSVAG
jgi:Uma2 family endonuclease